MAKTTSCVVYWLRDERCICPWRHGYIGISERWPRRLIRHRRESPRSFEWKILFEGSVEECMKLEGLFRSRPMTGWNLASGGIKGGGTAPKKEPTREKMRAAALARYTKPGEKEYTSRAVKRGLKGVNRSGANNANFGKHMSEAAKDKVRAKIVERGWISPTKGRQRTDAEKRAISEGTKRAMRKRGQLDFDL